jgi:PITH domain
MQGYREDAALFLESDADEQLILHIHFTSAIRLSAITIAGVCLHLGSGGGAPKPWTIMCLIDSFLRVRWASCTTVLRGCCSLGLLMACNAALAASILPGACKTTWLVKVCHCYQL